MVVKRTPGLDEVDAFVGMLDDAGIETDNGRNQYRLGAQLLNAAYGMYQEQFKRAPRSDKGKDRTE